MSFVDLDDGVDVGRSPQVQAQVVLLSRPLYCLKMEKKVSYTFVEK